MMASLRTTLKDPELFQDKAYINGRWVSPSPTTFPVHNPASSEVIGHVSNATIERLDEAIQAASDAFQTWRAYSGRQRARILAQWARLIMASQEDLGAIITAENGKPRAEADGEVAFAAGFFEWFAEEAPRLHGDVVPHSNAEARTTILRQPVGVCGLITPWNFPLSMAARKVSAALAAGCTAVLKSDGVAPFASNALAVLGERAGVPPGVFNVLPGLDNTPQLGLRLCESAAVKKISFTGSTRVGKILMKQSSSTLKKLSLELGGNAPFIVFDDADMELAVQSAVIAKFKGSGQTCVCVNRFFVHENVYEKFSQALVAKVTTAKVGNGADVLTTHGPMTTKAGVEKVQEHIEDALSKGATLLLGGQRLDKETQGNFHQLTILGDANRTMKVFDEETFGPLAVLTKFSTEDEVIAAANDVELGLASYIMTNNLQRAHRVSERLDYGMVAINTGVMSDWSAP